MRDPSDGAIAPEIDTEVDHPFPPRHPWVRRLGIFAVLLIVCVTASRIWWGYEAQRRLNHELQRIATRGEPLQMSDFNVDKPIPDEENAVYFYRQASKPRHPKIDVVQAWGGPSPHESKAWQQAARTGYESNQEVFKLIRRASQCKGAYWEPGRGESIEEYFQDAREIGGLAPILKDAAWYESTQGNDLGVLSLIAEMRQLARVCDQLPGGNAATGSAVRQMSGVALVMLSPHLKSVKDEAVKHRIRDLLPELLNDQSRIGGIVSVTRYDRVKHFQAIEQSREGLSFLRPMGVMSQVRMADAYDERVNADQLQDLPAVKDMEARIRSRYRYGSDVRIADLQYEADRPDLFRSHWVFEMDRRCIDRMAAVSLAARLYHAEHEKWPESLQALVPEYLPAVPMDPMVANEPLRYMLVRGGLPGGGDRPVVYSAGADGTFHTRGPEDLPQMPVYEFVRKPPNTEGIDQWRDITLWKKE